LKTIRWFFTLSIPLLLVVVLVSYAIYHDYRTFLDTPLAISESSVDFVVPRGASMKSVAERLAANGYLTSFRYLQIYAWLQGLAPRIKAGEYRFTSGITPSQLLDKLVAGRVIQYSLTVLEGWTFRQLLEALAKHKKLEPTLKGLSDNEIMAQLGQPGKHPEGRFFPDTYHFPAGTTDVDFLKRAAKKLARQLAQAWAQRDSDLPLKTPYEALILASIIEKETAVPEEYKQVAGVFIRRLEKNMRLQADPTVIYGMGVTFDGNIRKTDLRAETPYNTYVHKGLPPTPIALPGAGAIAAAVNPAPGDALYFVASGNGRHVFSRTLQEHNRAVRKYQLGQGQ
jgi:UPF0755 protein